MVMLAVILVSLFAICIKVNSIPCGCRAGPTRNDFANVIDAKRISGPRFAPYFDVTKNVSLESVYEQTGQADFILAFALGSNDGCVPKWDGEVAIDDPKILAQIQSVINKGGQVIVSTGGAMGPYLEDICTTPESLVKAYITALDVVSTNHLDIDIEASFDVDQMSEALAMLQKERPNTTISFTLMVQGDDYGVTPTLGVNILKSAQQYGVNIQTCNIMAMEYSKSNASQTWGESIVSAAESTILQLAEIWPDKSKPDLYDLLGITPMLGQNYNGNIFTTADAQVLADYVQSHNVGFVSFWSIGRDNGGCATGIVSPNCSGIAQSEFEFTQIFKQMVA